MVLVANNQFNQFTYNSIKKSSQYNTNHTLRMFLWMCLFFCCVHFSFPFLYRFFIRIFFFSAFFLKTVSFVFIYFFQTFEGTIFVSSATIGIAIGLCSILTVICLLRVACRLRRGSRHEDKWYPQPEKSNKVIPTIQLKQPPRLPWERPQYIP